MNTELLVASRTATLADALHGYEGLRVLSVSAVARIRSLLASDDPPQALYLDDTLGTLPELWALIAAAQQRRVPVLLGLQSVGLVHRADFIDAGIAVTELRDPVALAAWIAQQLGARERAGVRGQAVLAVAGAKGGIGKTVVVAALALGCVARGLRVLVVDGDLSNSGLVPTFRIPSGFPSYLALKHDGLGAFTPANVRRHLLHQHPSGIDFLLGAEETANPVDLLLPEWQALMQAVRALDGYDVVLLDTGPEIKKRPYAIDAARTGGFVLLPCPPGRKERSGVGNALQVFEQHTPDLTERCFLLYMEPEQGVTVSVEQIAPLFAQRFPKTRALGVLPRAPRQLSLADEEGDRYLSPLTLAPHSRFSRAVHGMVETLCAQIGIVPPQPMPRSSLWQRLRGEQIALPQLRAPAITPIQEVAG